VASVRRSWAVFADAFGHCVFIFAFLPTLAALPRWLAFEARNALNLQDPVVLTFLPVRGAVLLLNTFAEGVMPGVIEGAIAGVLVCAWVAGWRALPARPRQWALGAAIGLVAAALVVAGTLAFALVAGRAAHVPVSTVAFELAAGAVCGALAFPGAARLVRG
jgi:hypothetical protein